MKINTTIPSSGTVSVQQPVAQRPPAPETGVTGRSDVSGKDAEVSLSSTARSLQASEEAPVDSGKIGEIRQAISEGRFTVRPEVIADRLIDSARELIRSQQNLS